MGDREAFAALYRAHHGAVELRLIQLVGRGPTVDDLVQETFEKAYRARGSFRGECSFRAWVLAIATRVALSAHRSMRRSLWRLFAGPDEEDALAPVIDAPPDARTAMTALAALSPKLRDAVWRHDVDGQTLAEIAHELALPLHTVAARVRRGREALRARVLGRATRVAALLVAATLAASVAYAWLRVHAMDPRPRQTAPRAITTPATTPTRRPVPEAAPPARALPPRTKRAKRPPPKKLHIDEEPFGDVIEVARPAPGDPLFTVEDYKANGH